MPKVCTLLECSIDGDGSLKKGIYFPKMTMYIPPPKKTPMHYTYQCCGSGFTIGSEGSTFPNCFQSSYGQATIS